MIVSNKKHIKAGAKKVLVTTVSKDVPIFIKGVNFDSYKKTSKVVSSGSSTGNCASVLIKALHKKFCIQSCLITTILPLNTTQPVHDGLDYVSMMMIRETEWQGRITEKYLMEIRKPTSPKYEYYRIFDSILNLFSVLFILRFRDWYFQKSGADNIVPYSTCTEATITSSLPDFKGKVHGDAARIPILNVSLLKLFMK